MSGPDVGFALANGLLGGAAQWLLAWPSLVKMAVVFGLMLAIVRLRVNVGWALCIGAVLCGFWFGQDVVGIVKSVGTAMTSGRQIALVAIILLILVLNHTLRQGGQIQRIVDSFFKISRRPRTTLVFFPALLGLLPMPGGALFSAPMVDAAGTPLGVSDRDKTLINYWFRHIWEHAWPLYPGIFLTATYSGYSIGQVCLYQFPLVIISALAGYFFFVRGLKVSDPPAAAAGGDLWASVRAFMREIAPIWLVILTYAVLRAGDYAAKSFLSEGSSVRMFLVGVPESAAIVVGIIIATVYTWRANRMDLKSIWRVFWQKDMFDNLVIVLGIIAFAGILAGSGAAGRVAEELQRHRIPIALVAMVLPFTVGAITGITMNMVALTYPVFLAALGAAGLQSETMGYLALAFASGYSGIIITPVHICMVQSNNYFRLSATATLRHLVFPTLCMIAGGVALFGLYVYALPRVGWVPGGASGGP